MDSADEASSSSVANELYYLPLFSTFNVKPSPQRHIVLRNQENLIPTPYQQPNKEIEERLGRMKVSARRSTHEWQRELRSVVALERRRSFSGFSLQMRSSEIVYESLPRAGSLRTARRSYMSVGLVSRGNAGFLWSYPMLIITIVSTIPNDHHHHHHHHNTNYFSTWP